MTTLFGPGERFSQLVPLRVLLLLVTVQMASLATPMATGQEFPAAEPATVGLSPEALQRLSEAVQSYLDNDQIVGAELLVIKDRKAVLHEAFGWRDRDTEVAMTPNTIFNIRSMTKPLTGAAVQILIDEGRLHLEDRAAQYIPAFDTDESRAITIEQLLTHRSGLPLTVMASVNQYDDLLATATAAGKRGPQFPPGSKFWYSDAGTDVLGAIVEQVSGQKLHEFWRERLFEPLGMRDSWVPLKREDERWGRLASSYLGQPGSWFPFWTPAKPPLYPFAWGSQSVYSTTMDYARFLALWMDGGKAGAHQILSESAVARTLEPVSAATGMGSDQRIPTGLQGLSVFYGQLAVLWGESQESAPVAIGHSGSDGTFAWAWPDRDLMVLYFTQSRGGISGLSLERWIDDLLVHPDRASAAEVTSTRYEELAGEYLADFGGLRDTTIGVSLSRGRPLLDLGRGRLIELRDPDEKGLWAFAINDKSAVSFARNRAGEINALRLHEGNWRFEAPRKGVPIEAEQDPAELEKYLGTYRAEEMDATITVLVHNHRLTLDKSKLPVRLPADLFELLPPVREDGDSASLETASGDPLSGRWVYRVNPRLAVAFDESSEGVVTGLRVYEDGDLEIVATRELEKDAGAEGAADGENALPSLDDLMALRNAQDTEELISRLGGVRLTGEITLTQTAANGEFTMSLLGTDSSRFEAELANGLLIEVLSPEGATGHYFGQEFVHQGKHLEQARRAHPLLLLLDWRSVYDHVAVEGREPMGDRKAIRVRTEGGGLPSTVRWLDLETGDVLRSETVQLSIAGDTRMVIRYEDYRLVHGLRLPHRTVTSTQLGGEVVEEVTGIEVDQQFPEGHFQLDETEEGR